MKIPFTSRVIEFKTFFRKRPQWVDDRYGCYFICGRQGSFKTYYAIRLADKQDKNTVAYLKTNIHSLKIPSVKIEYFNTIDEVYHDTDENVIYIIDEISRKYDKSSRTDTQFYAWLNQSRKRHRIVILITQEWKELPMWIRRPCKYMISSHRTKLLGRFGFITTIVGDGENLVFNKDEGEYECPTIQVIYHKLNYKYTNMYDTFEPINML